jgi:hypothetical protein
LWTSQRMNDFWFSGFCLMFRSSRSRQRTLKAGPFYRNSSIWSFDGESCPRSLVAGGARIDLFCYFYFFWFSGTFFQR